MGNSDRGKKIKNDLQCLPIDGVTVVKQRLNGHTKPPGLELKRRFTLGNGVSICMGLMLGISMFISPTGVIKGTHSAGLALVAWGVCGLVSMLDAMVFTEMGTTFPRSGFLYVYLEEFYGPLPAFLFLWEYYLFHRGASNAIKCLTFAVYALEPFFVGCEVPGAAVTIVGILVAALITFINLVNVKLSARVQMVFVTGVVLSFVFIIGVAVYHVISGGTIHLDHLFDNINPNTGEVVIGFYSAIYAYLGWEALSFMVAEVHNPERVLPWSIGISLALVTVIFSVINLAYTIVLGAEGIMNANGVAASMLQRVIGGGSAITAVLIIFNTAGSFNSGTLAGSRLGYASAQRGHFPTILSLIHVQYLTPIASLLFQFILVVICCIVGNVFFILNNVVFAYYCFKALAVAGHIHHRIKYPDFPRPLKVPLVISFLVMACYMGILIVPLLTKPLDCVIGMAVCVGTGIPYYFIFISQLFKIPRLDALSNHVLVVTQKLLNAALPDGHKTG